MKKNEFTFLAVFAFATIVLLASCTHTSAEGQGDPGTSTEPVTNFPDNSSVVTPLAPLEQNQTVTLHTEEVPLNEKGSSTPTKEEVQNTVHVSHVQVEEPLEKAFTTDKRPGVEYSASIYFIDSVDSEGQEYPLYFEYKVFNAPTKTDSAEVESKKALEVARKTFDYIINLENPSDLYLVTDAEGEILEVWTKLHAKKEKIGNVTVRDPDPVMIWPKYDVPQEKNK